jgi:hypothetical protein
VRIEERFTHTDYAENLSLWGCIARLWQRPIQIRNLIRAIVDYTPISHPDWQNLVRTLTKMELTVSHLEECQREGEFGAVHAEFHGVIARKDRGPM